MKLPIALATSAAVLGLAVLPGAANAAPDASQTVFVDSHVGSATTQFPLPAGTYTVKVKGTYSAYAASLYNQPSGSYFATCGTSEDTPLFSSPGVTDGPVGVDPRFLFAAPHKPFKCGNFNPPYAQDKFQVAKGAGAFAYPAWLGGDTVPKESHQYHFTLKTTSEQFASFKIVDSNYADNDGRLRVTIAPKD